LQDPVVHPQHLTHGKQFHFIHFSEPVGFESSFQFAVNTHSWETEICGNCHKTSPRLCYRSANGWIGTGRPLSSTATSTKLPFVHSSRAPVSRSSAQSSTSTVIDVRPVLLT